MGRMDYCLMCNINGRDITRDILEPENKVGRRRDRVRKLRMRDYRCSRRDFGKTAGTLAIGSLLGQASGCKPGTSQPDTAAESERTADYTLVIAVKPVELAPNRIVSTTTYNGQVPGPLLRFKEGKPVTIDIHNETDTPEQLHWHGQFLPTDVDGAAAEATPFIPPHGSRRITFVPKPSGYRFYHTHVHATANLTAGQYSGLVGPVYIEPQNNPGNYDREIFLTLKEFEPTLSRGDLRLGMVLSRSTDECWAAVNRYG
jgi:FtsP/CotA-like multicopper oxidase with cupredoxin domain